MIQPNARGVWEEIERYLRPFVARRLDDPGDVNDVLQELYLRIQTGLPGLRDGERFGPWVYQVARHVLIDHGRTRTRQRARVEPLANEADLPATVSHDDEELAERELATYMATFIAALPSPYREAITLTELQGLTQKDAADILGISLSGMKSRVQRGRKQIGEMLRQCCEIALDARGRVLSYERRVDGKVPKDCCAELKSCKC